MAQLVKIGNSQGVVIPKPLIEQADLSGKELHFKIVDDGLLIAPEKLVRAGWKQAIQQTINAQGHEPLDEEWLDIPLASVDK